MTKNTSTLVITKGHVGDSKVNPEEVVLSNETKLDIFGNRTKCSTSRATNSPCYKLKHIMLIVTHAGAGNIMLCRCFSAGG